MTGSITTPLPKAGLEYSQSDQDILRRSIEQKFEELYQLVLANRDLKLKPASLAMRRLQFMAMAGAQPSLTSAYDLPQVSKGIFTPTIQDVSLSDGEGQSYSNQSGRYTKVGDTVSIWIDITVSSLGSLTTSGQTYIAGLPFLPNSISVVHCGYASSVNMTSGDSISGVIGFDTSQDVIRCYRWGGTTGPAWLLLSELTASGRLIFAGQYTTDE